MSLWLYLGSSASSGNPSLAWSCGNGGKGRMLIKFPLPLDDGWYNEQPCTTFRSFQHRKERSGFKHEFIVLQLLDGSVCRIERMGDPNARFDALSPRGSVAHDMAQCFRPDELDQACLGSSEVVADVKLPCDFDLMDVLKICRAIHEGEKTRSYTLQVFNCYFFSLAIQVCLTHLVAHWEDQALFEKWLSDINTGILALPATFQPLVDPSLRHGSILFRVYHALFPHDFDSTQNSSLVEAIKLRLSLWINERPEAVLQEITYRINNLLWHSTIESGLDRFVEEKAKEAILAVVRERMLLISNDASNENETPSLAMEKLKGEALLLLTRLLAMAGTNTDKIPKLNKVPLKSKAHYSESHPSGKPSELGFKKSPTVQATKEFVTDWYQWIIYYLSHASLWLLITALDIWGVTLFAIRNNSITCTMIDEKLERVAYEMERMTRPGYTDLERLVDELRALSESQVAVWGKNPWADICDCIAKYVSINILEENATHKPVIWFCPKRKHKPMVLQSISAFQVHIQNRIETQAKEVESVWLGSAGNIQAELVDTLSQVWKLIREDATLANKKRRGMKARHHRVKQTNTRTWVREVQQTSRLQGDEGNNESESESESSSQELATVNNLVPGTRLFSCDYSPDPSDESRFNGDSTGNTSDQRGRPRPRSPMSKRGVVEFNWKAAQILLFSRLFFWDYKVDQPPELYCWCMIYVPTTTGNEIESQLWHVSLSISWIPTRFQLQERLSHSHFREGQAILMGHRLVLPSRSYDSRVLYRYPENTLVFLHEDLGAVYQEFVAVNKLTSTPHMVEQNILIPQPSHQI